MLASRWLIGALAVSAPALAGAASLKTLYSITPSPDGVYPYAPLTELGGVLYGTTSTGGVSGHGIVFRIDPSTGKEKVLYNFSGGADGDQPSGALVAVQGQLFGVTSRGGTNGNGTVFKIDPGTGAQTVVYDFTGRADGGYPVSVIDGGGLLYGITSGNVFSLDPDSNTETTIYTFQGGSDGDYPTGLIIKDGSLYGTTENGGASGAGTVFKVNPVTGAESVIYSVNFSTDGYDPVGLTDVANQLYVTLFNGGPTYLGSVIKVDLATEAESTVYAFRDGADGARPGASLVRSGSALYGTTTLGGTSDQGTVFKVDTATGLESAIYSFTGGTDGGFPTTALTPAHNGKFYGTTYYGGLHGGGAAFELDPANGSETAIHGFASQLLQYDYSVGALSTNGKLYFTAGEGGPFNRGAVVRIDPTNGATKIVDGFAQVNDSNAPQAPLTKVGSALYGTSILGGASDAGTVFKFDPRTGTSSVIYAFTDGADGGFPISPLLAFKGNLYGTTLLSEEGDATPTMFKLDPVTGVESVVYAFPYGDYVPGLINVKGVFYGTTGGTIFAFNPSSKSFTTVYTFSGNDGSFPAGNLLEFNGLLYGTNQTGGVNDAGTLFSFNPGNQAFTVLHAFNNETDGSSPFNTLVASNGLLYGVAPYGGTSSAGTIFSLNPSTDAFIVLYNFTGGAEGGAPCASLVALSGILYGGTCQGGAANLGTFFSLTP